MYINSTFSHRLAIMNLLFCIVIIFSFSILVIVIDIWMNIDWNVNYTNLLQFSFFTQNLALLYHIILAVMKESYFPSISQYSNVHLNGDILLLVLFHNKSPNIRRIGSNCSESSFVSNWQQTARKPIQNWWKWNATVILHDYFKHRTLSCMNIDFNSVQSRASGLAENICISLLLHQIESACALQIGNQV